MRVCGTCDRQRGRLDMKRESDSNLSGNEGCYTNSLISLVKNMLRGQLHCQKGFDLIVFSYKMSPSDEKGDAGAAILAGQVALTHQPYTLDLHQT